MSLNTVTLTWDLTDLLQAGMRATLSLTPNAVLTDATNHLVIPEVQRSAQFSNGTGSLAGIVACDNPTLLPSGWAYTLTVSVLGQGQLLKETVQINFANGASQDLSALIPLSPAPGLVGYLPLPSGTPQAGYVPIATGTGEASAWGPSGTGVALLGSPNVFTGNPQSVGSAYSSGEIQLFSTGQIVMASNGAAPPANAPPAIKLYGYCGGAAGLNGWDIGVDTHNHGGGQDFYIGRVVNGATNDIFYINYTSGAMGLGAATPPDDTHWLEILSSVNDTKDCLALGVGAGATGNALTIFASSGVPQVWVDSAFAFNSVAGGDGVLFAGEPTNQRIASFSNSAKTLLYGFFMDNSSSHLVVTCFTTGQQAIGIGTDGSTRILQNVGFYGANAVAQPTAGGVTAGFTAATGTTVVSGSTFTGNTGASAYTIGDIVHALKTMGLLAA